MRPAIRSAVCAFVLLLPGLSPGKSAVKDGLTFERMAAIRSVSAAEVAPDGTRIAFTLSVPRKPGEDDDGPAWRELHVVAPTSGSIRPYVTGEVNVSSIRFSADGRWITYLAKRADDEQTTLYAIPVNGGESRVLLSFDRDISDYAISPDRRRVAFVAREPEDKARKKSKKKGYKQEVFEEDWYPRQLRVHPLEPFYPPAEDPLASSDEPEPEKEPAPFELGGSAFRAIWSPDGKRLAVAVAPRPLIDDRYMLQRILVVDADNGKRVGRIENPGKLGDFRFSPDGKRIALISAEDPNDPSAGRLLVASASGEGLRDALPGLAGHVDSIAWRDSTTVAFVASVGVESRLGEVNVDSGDSTILHSSGAGGEPAAHRPLIRAVRLSADGERAALVAETPYHPPELFTMRRGEKTPKRLTESNPWLRNVELARQEPVRWVARDGLGLEGILIHPLDRRRAKSDAPLILMVHGGPESHDRNGWLTSYSRPGQLAAARGYAVLYPNYRGSTGRGVAFSKRGQGDAAGREFDDLVDAVDHLVVEGVADRTRVGITGGSYGGYATAWCSTRFSDHFRAGVMFVGISNKVSKGLTTEIPLEDKMVHTLYDPWTRWSYSLERSPIYHVENSRTPLLIAAGTDDTRVHPSQSLQLYRALKLIGESPVRYVRYPGEGHGNRNAAARDDYSRRLIRWMDHFLVDGATDLPPWEIEHGHAESERSNDDE